MSWAHIHLAISHLPVIGLLFAFLLLVAARLRRSLELTRVSYVLLVVLAVVAVAVYFTGEPAEELVEKLAGFSEPLVERHEDMALIATLGTVLLGLAALLGLARLRRGRTAGEWYGRGLLLLGLLVVGVMAWTANLGGQIRHSEIRSGQDVTAETGTHDAERADD